MAQETDKSTFLLENDELPEHSQILRSDGCYQSVIRILGNFIGFIGMWTCCTPYRTIQEGTRGVMTDFGRYACTLDPGYHYITPIAQSISMVNMMTHVIDLSRQQVLTRDNVTVDIDSVIYYRVVDPYRYTFTVQNPTHCLTELAQTALRESLAAHTLQESLEHREQLADEVKRCVEQGSSGWGVSIGSVLLKDIRLDKDMQRLLSSKATAERQAQAKIIDAQADVAAAGMMRKAADLLATGPAMQIRHLETMRTMASNPGMKLMFIPMDYSALGTTSASNIVNPVNIAATCEISDAIHEEPLQTVGMDRLC